MMSFTYLTNRASKVFAAAFTPQHGRPWCEHEEEVDLLYFDSYGGKQVPAGLKSRVQLLERNKTIPLDHKIQLAKRLTENGVNCPRHYFAIADVPVDPALNWYVKDPLSTGGKRLWRCKQHELPNYFQPGYIIQEAIDDLQLWRGYKFTLRTYVLVHDAMVYWYPESFLVVHGKRWDPVSTDPGVHYDHSGYTKHNSPVKLLSSKEYRPYFKLEMPIVECLQRVFELYQSELGPDNPQGSFCLFGVDLLQRSNGEVVLIEINDRPNLVHTPAINAAVNQPMLGAMSRLLLPGQVPQGPAVLFEELMFFE